jgi:hypothetical protein
MQSADKFNYKTSHSIWFRGGIPTYSAMSNFNKALPNDVTSEGHDKPVKFLLSARIEVTIAAYERVFKDASHRNELVTPHHFDVEWVLARHGGPFEVRTENGMVFPRLSRRQCWGLAGYRIQMGRS